MRPTVLIVCALVTLVPSSRTFAGSRAVAKSAAIATDSPIATSIGLDVLRHGGSAMDAAVAASFALAVSHPQAGNLGGGGSLVYYDAASKSVWTLDFRDAIPLEPSTGDGDGRHILTPGSVAGLAAAHERFGKLPWNRVVGPAAKLAAEGIRVDRELEADLASAQKEKQLGSGADRGSVLFPGGKPAASGSTLKQPDLATTLERIARNGASEIYEGAVAKKVVETVQAHGGSLTLRDLREYAPSWKAPLRIDDRDYSLYTMAPPSTGGVVLAESLAILSGYDLRKFDRESPRLIHLLAEVSRRAFLDANQQFAGRTRARIPYEELFSAARAKQWRDSIRLDRASSSIMLSATFFRGEHTTHISTVDANGNVASLTTSLGDDFGSGVMVEGAGFFLNEHPIPQVEPSADETSSEPESRLALDGSAFMTPTIIFHHDRPWLVLGSRGGATIPGSILQVYLDLVVWKLPIDDAIESPRYIQQAFPDLIFYEADRGDRKTIDALNAMGHAVRRVDAIGDVQAILIDDNRLIAVSDPRHTGAAGGY